MSAGHSPPGTATQRGWDSPSFLSPRPRYTPFPALARRVTLCAWRSPRECCGQGVAVPPPTQHWSPCVCRVGSALLHSAPLFSSTQIPPSLPPCCPGLSFLPHTFPSSSHIPSPGGGTPQRWEPRACDTPRQVTAGRTLRPGREARSSQGRWPRCPLRPWRAGQRRSVAAKALSTVGRADRPPCAPPLRSGFCFVLFCFKQ